MGIPAVEALSDMALLNALLSVLSYGLLAGLMYRSFLK